ncbi:2-keto-3-deoxygluconate permease [Treponema phagedenis F0421]|uniref:2-keto-3-deoxygluconate permease n=2 Tax=Treponema phagedenis TaxID=162 RepID=UPI0001F63795|nr:2-keto-3-deoxygluconate permease [Treponema phagedenis]EFW36922.1 2-keto-3-deoxygluconate permease [Treponema phagedenis F0421]
MRGVNMLKIMKKVPGGILLVPMLISALFNTFLPGFFGKYGGISDALFTTKGINYIVGLITLCSSTALNFRSLIKVFKKQGVLILAKIILCLIFSIVFMRLFGINGILGISAIAFTASICSTNPSLYLALVNDYGEENDQGAFGLLGLLCVPAVPAHCFQCINGNNNRLESDYFNINSYGNRYFNR